MITRLRTCIVAAVVAIGTQPCRAPAQAGNAVSDALRIFLRQDAAKLTQAVDLMPPDKFDFRPTPGNMTFAQLVRHTGVNNDQACARIVGSKPTAEPWPAAGAPVADLVARYRRSFGICEEAFASLTDAGINDSIAVGPKVKWTRAALMIDIVADWENHYGAIATYLRLNGILPPTARPPAPKP